MWTPEENNLPGRSKWQRDKALRDIKSYHRLHPTSGIAPPITPETVLSFGKHKGKMVKEVPYHYLKYIAEQCRKDGKSLYTDNIYDRIRQWIEN